MAAEFLEPMENFQIEPDSFCLFLTGVIEFRKEIFQETE